MGMRRGLRGRGGQAILPESGTGLLISEEQEDTGAETEAHDQRTMLEKAYVKTTDPISCLRLGCVGPARAPGYKGQSRVVGHFEAGEREQIQYRN